MDARENKSPPLERYIRILEMLAGFPEGLSLTEIAKMLAVPKASTHRLLASMQRSDLVASGEGATYVLGRRAKRLVQLSAGTAFVEAATTSLLQQLSEETGETCYIAALQGCVVRTVAMQSPDTPWRGFVLPGKIMYANATAAARAILAYQPEELVDRALAGELPALTRHTKTTPEAVKASLRDVRQTGVSLCIGEVDEGLGAIAVPIDVPPAGVIYALGAVGPLSRIQSLLAKGIAVRMEGVAAAMSACLLKGGTAIPATAGTLGAASPR